MDKIDILKMDVPLFIRLLEYAREDAKTDMDLHSVAENIIALSRSNEPLTMSDYDDIIPKKSSTSTVTMENLRRLAGIA